MSECKAIINVWGSQTCGRSAGHGPDGAYCKQHAIKMFPPEATIPMWKVDTFWFNRFVVKQLYVISATPKTVTAADGGREARVAAGHRWFESFDEMREFVIVEAEKLIAKAEDTIDINRKMIEAVSSGKYKEPTK